MIHADPEAIFRVGCFFGLHDGGGPAAPPVTLTRPALSGCTCALARAGRLAVLVLKWRRPMPLSSNGAARKSSMPTTLAAAPAMPDNGVGAFDPLSELLRRVKLSAWVAGMSELRSPWGLRVPTQAGGFYAICEGSACLQVDDGPVHMMAAGDVALVTRGVENIIRDAPGSPTRSVLKLVSPEMARRHEGLRLDGPGPRTRMICGAFRFDGEASRPLPSARPPVLVARGRRVVRGRVARGGLDRVRAGLRVAGLCAGAGTMCAGGS